MSPKTAAFFLSLLAIVPSAVRADTASDEILAELRALRAKVDSLEARIAQLETAPPKTASAAVEPAQTERKWFDRLNLELKKAEVRASGPWTTESTWQKVHVGMEVDALIDLLGEPTGRKFSVRRDTDEIFFYEGDLEGTGEAISGEIRIYKGKIRRFTAPDFPQA